MHHGIPRTALPSAARPAAPLGADSLRGWCAQNPAVVKGGGSGADRGPAGWVLPVIGQRSARAVGMVRTACFSRVGCFGEW